MATVWVRVFGVRLVLNSRLESVSVALGRIRAEQEDMRTRTPNRLDNIWRTDRRR